MRAAPSLIDSFERRIGPLETERLVLRKKVGAGCLLFVVLVLVAIVLAGVAAGGMAWFITTHVSDSWLGELFGYLFGVALVGYGSYRVTKPLLLSGARSQEAFAQRWNNEVVLPTVSEIHFPARLTAESRLDHATFRAGELFGGERSDTFDTALGITGSSCGISWLGARVNVHVSTSELHNRSGQTYWRLRGWYFRLNYSSPFAGTVRLVDRAIYTTFVPGHTKIGRAKYVVRVDSGEKAFEAKGMLVLDEQHPELPPLPQGLLRAWVTARERLDLPIFLSLNASGTYLGISTGDGPLPLDYSWVTANKPERLAADVLLLQQLPDIIGLFCESISQNAE